jgi:hypothetical protein
MPPRISRLNKVMQLAGQVITQPFPIRPPMTGWNTRDDFDGMDPTDAIVMDNWYADAGGLNTRRGSTPWSANLGAPVETLAEYYTGTTRKLIACAGGKVIDITAGGAGTTLGTGFGSAIWSAANFSARLFLANGVDPVQALNGATLASAAFTGPAVPPIGVMTFKNRLFFWLPNSPVFWYTPLYNVTGALTAFDVSTVAQWGGNIICLTNFSHDGGDGVTNLFVIVMTTGEILLYLGDDPSLSTNWQIVGKYKLAAPVNQRSIAAYGGDVYLTTNDDHVALQEQLTALKVGQTPPRSKITGAVRSVIAISQASPTPGYGFQSMYYGKGRRVIFNVPSTLISPNPAVSLWDQHVYNTSNQSWQRFQGMNALCWSEFNQNLYFGTQAGFVWQADIGSNDNGLPILCNVQQAWNPYQLPANKRLAGLRPILIGVSAQGYKFYAGFDYKGLILQIVGSGGFGLPLWDVTPWGSPWATEGGAVDLGVHAAAGSGTSISFQLQASVLAPMIWMRTDLVLEPSKQI